MQQFLCHQSSKLNQSQETSRTNLPSQHWSGVGLNNLQAQCPLSLCQPLCQWAESHQQAGSVVTQCCHGCPSGSSWWEIGSELRPDWSWEKQIMTSAESGCEECVILGRIQLCSQECVFKSWLLLTRWHGQVFSSLHTSVLLICDMDIVISALMTPPVALGIRWDTGLMLRLCGSYL